ncbi:MAG: tRNA pseudouridine synthase A [Salinivirgaceae bacterium]|nr:tRNA pseudouridine synthase A [Salinivirgaceae bacterium]
MEQNRFYEKRYFVHMAYHGYNYHGWQRQINATSVQQIMEESLTKLLRSKITCLGCGRTDAMVHASQYFFHFDFGPMLPSNLLFTLNKVLPDDIAVFDIIPMEGFPHAQYAAIERSYEYYIHTRKDPFLHKFSALYEEPSLDLTKMKQTVDILPKYSDYSQFCKSPDRNDDNFCNIATTKLFTNQKQDRVRFQITANRYIQGMIRVIVRRLIDIGRGKLSVDEFEAILEGAIKPKKIVVAYPQGLYLTKIKYPFLELPSGSDFIGGTNNGDDYWTEC